MDGYLESCDGLDTRQFALAIKRLADSLSYGADRSSYLGSGVEYVQSRGYQWGDPIRIIDWKVTARTGKIHVKEYEAPKRMPCMILLDSSASMMISSVKRSKYATAIHIAGGLALASLDRLSPVGLMTVGERDMYYKPSLSKGRIMQWLDRLRRFRFDEHTQLAAKSEDLGQRMKNRALIIILSDFHEAGALQSVKRLSQRHDVVVLSIRDPAEQSLSNIGFVRAREAETGAHFVARSQQQWIDDSELEDQLRRAGIDHMRIVTDQPFAHQLRFFFSSRDLLGKGAR